MIVNEEYLIPFFIVPELKTEFKFELNIDLLIIGFKDIIITLLEAKKLLIVLLNSLKALEVWNTMFFS